ncbi:PHF6 protein, partial [Polypterus senegalus]|nr:PHF6 protein [Polypterus senegalus]
MGRKKRACGFCKLFCESKKTGPLLEKEDVCAHELCMLYSSNLITKKDPEGDDFAGFLIEDVKRELKRGEKLTLLQEPCFHMSRRNHTVNSRKRKKPTEKVQPDHEINQLSYDSESTDDSVDYAMPKMDEREAQSESTLDPMLSMPQCSSGKEEEFWQLCKNTGCVEKIFSKITDELTNVSMKITNHNASDNDYKFAFAVVMASGLLPQIMLENEAETDAKLESLLVQHKLLSQAKSAMQEVKTKMNQWQS